MSGVVANGRAWAVRFVGLAACAFALASCVYPTGPIEWERWEATIPDHASTPVRAKVDAIEAHLLERHLAPEGVLVYRRPDEPFDASASGGWENLADETIWTGCLAAAYAFKLGVTGDGADRDLLLRVLGGMRLLHDVTGSPGLFSRGVAARGVAFKRPRRADQEWRDGAAGYEGYIYRGDVSKDQYFGALFGYAATTVALGLGPGAGDPAARDAIADVVVAVADHIWAHGLRIVDADGRTTTFGNLSGFIAFVPIGPNASLVLGWQLLAWRLTGEERLRQRYLDLVRRGYADATSWNKIQFFGRTNHNNDVMAMMGLYALCLLEPEPGLRKTYRESLEHHWGLVANEGNLLYHGVRVAALGPELPDHIRRDIAETYRLFPVDLHVSMVDLRDEPAVERAFFNGRDGTPRNATALPLHLRPLSSFVWKSSPYALVAYETLERRPTVSGVDFLLAYWMGRYYGLIDATGESPPAER